MAVPLRTASSCRLWPTFPESKCASLLSAKRPRWAQPSWPGWVVASGRTRPNSPRSGTPPPFTPRNPPLITRISTRTGLISLYEYHCHSWKQFIAICAPLPRLREEGNRRAFEERWKQLLAESSGWAIMLAESANSPRRRRDALNALV
jgi:hypothetical protein